MSYPCTSALQLCCCLLLGRPHLLKQFSFPLSYLGQTICMLAFGIQIMELTWYNSSPFKFAHQFPVLEVPLPDPQVLRICWDVEFMFCKVFPFSCLNATILMYECDKKLLTDHDQPGLGVSHRPLSMVKPNRTPLFVCGW